MSAEAGTAGSLSPSLQAPGSQRQVQQHLPAPCLQGTLPGRESGQGADSLLTRQEAMALRQPLRSSITPLLIQ